MTHTLKIKDCLKFGWKTFKSRPWIFVKIFLVTFAFGILSQMVVASTRFFGEGVPATLAVKLPVLVLYAIAMVLLTMGTWNFYLKAHDDVKKVGLKELWHPHPLRKSLGVMILTGVLTLVGTMLLIIPGIIVGTALAFSLFIALETKLGIVASLKESARLTKGKRWSMFLLFVSFFALFLPGMALYMILIQMGTAGLLVGFVGFQIYSLVLGAVSTLALVHAYRTLKGGHAPSHASAE